MAQRSVPANTHPRGGVASKEKVLSMHSLRVQVHCETRRPPNIRFGVAWEEARDVAEWPAAVR